MTNSLFLQVDGVTGESQDANHPGWITINSYSWGAMQAATTDGSELRTEKVSYHDLRIDADADSSVTTMLKLCASGEHIGRVTVSARKASKTATEYNTVLLKDVLITGVQLARTHSGEQMVTYSFQGAKIEHRYWSQQKELYKIPERQVDWDAVDTVAAA